MTMGLKVFDTLGTITMVTPPSMLNPHKISFCLVNLKEEQHNQFATQLNKLFPNDNITVFVYDSVHGDAPWIRQATMRSKFIVAHKKDLPPFVEELLAKEKTYEINADQTVEEAFKKIKESELS
tara:strand:+ start:2521 stop:2892 length:372 start_codon:yes stop_codon:yes gene_type:complete